MTNWSFDPENNAGTLLVEGDMTINHVADLKNRLIAAFDSAESVTVDVSATTAVDVAGVQLLCACQRYSLGRGKQMRLLMGENTGFLDFLAEIGFARDFIANYR